MTFFLLPGSASWWPWCPCPPRSFSSFTPEACRIDWTKSENPSILQLSVSACQVSHGSKGRNLFAHHKGEIKSNFGEICGHDVVSLHILAQLYRRDCVTRCRARKEDKIEWLAPLSFTFTLCVILASRDCWGKLGQDGKKFSLLSRGNHDKFIGTNGTTEQTMVSGKSRRHYSWQCPS